jgi:hypothetical protein
VNNEAIKILTAFTEAYGREAMGMEASVSGDIEPMDIITAMFGSVREARRVFLSGILINKGKKKDVSKLSYDLLLKGWWYERRQNSISLLALGVILNQWKWVNEHNPFERKTANEEPS